MSCLEYFIKIAVLTSVICFVYSVCIKWRDVVKLNKITQTLVYEKSH